MPPGFISHQHISCCTTTSFHSRPPHFAVHSSFCITLTLPHLTSQKCTSHSHKLLPHLTSHFISQTIPHIATYSCTSQLHSTSHHPATSDHIQHHTPCRYPFHPCVTTVARKRSRSFCQKCRWQVTAKHIHACVCVIIVKLSVLPPSVVDGHSRNPLYYLLLYTLCMKWHGTWLYGVHRTAMSLWRIALYKLSSINVTLHILHHTTWNIPCTNTSPSPTSCHQLSYHTNTSHIV